MVLTLRLAGSHVSVSSTASTRRPAVRARPLPHVAHRLRVPVRLRLQVGTLSTPRGAASKGVFGGGMKRILLA